MKYAEANQCGEEMTWGHGGYKEAGRKWVVITGGLFGVSQTA
jgi:hypothetical protein